MDEQNQGGGLAAAIKHNEKVKPNTELLEQLRANFPQYFDRDGNFKADKFNAELKANNVSESRDGYRLNFVGKDYARLQTGLASETMLVPDCRHNAQPENADSGNVFITGDNLEALRHLQNAYEGKVKMIYIDPPYNTGKEFTYNDRFEFSDEKLKSALGYDDNEIARLRSLQGKSSHSAWLTFMYPRLKIAQKLLTDDGVIFVSIDDNEQANLKLLMDDVFGEGNFVANFIWQHSIQPKGYTDTVSIHHNHILLYQETNNYKLRSLSRTEEDNKAYSNPDNDPKGLWRSGDVRNALYRPNLIYDIISPSGKVIKPCPNGWRWSKETVAKKIETGEIIFSKDETRIIRKIYLGSIDGRTPESIWFAKDVGSTRDAMKDLKSLFDDSPFDTPKPVSLIKRMLQIGSEQDSIILDFFAGSATTAHAVMQLNAEDGGNRKFIMVQIGDDPAETSEARPKYETIDQISRKRIELAAKKIKSEAGMFADKIDTGFKHYLLQTQDVPTLDKITNFVPDDNLFATDMLTPFANRETGTSGVDTILTTWLIDDGCPFDTKVETRKFADYSAHYVPDTATLYLINEGWTTDSLRAMLNEIGQGKLGVQTIVIYPYSFGFTELRELKTNVKTNLENTPNIIERY
jgi:adenine-specific DNA-methyltransferase